MEWNLPTLSQKYLLELKTEHRYLKTFLGGKMVFNLSSLFPEMQNYKLAMGDKTEKNSQNLI